MTTREQLYRKFGPLLLEALTRTLVKQINYIRTQLALSPITAAEFIDELETELTELPEYDWMQEDI